MDPVETEPGLEGLGAVLAGLVRGNIERDPARARLLRGRLGRVNVRALDAGVAAGILLGGGRFRVRGTPLPEPHLDVACDSETLMSLSSVPLRFGLPDVGTPEGRAVVAKMLRGDLRVRGMLLNLPVLMRLQRLLSVA